MDTKKSLSMIVVLGLFYLSGCATLEGVLQKKPSASLQGVHLADITLKSASLVFDVAVENPYSVSLPLMNLDYELTSNARELFTGVAEVQTTIPAQSSKEVALPVTLNYLDVLKAFKDVRPGSVIPFEAVVGLSVDTPVVGQIRLPINKTGEMKVPAIPKASDINLKQLLDKVRN